MKRRTKKNLIAVFSAFCCFTVYCLTAFLLLSRSVAKTDTPLENVPYKEVPEDFSLLLKCDELEQYCGLIFDIESNHLTAVLFDSLHDATSYGIKYDRTVNYGKEAEINIIGWLGGIVFLAQNGYNGEKDFLWEFRDGTRIFGSKAISLAENDQYRAVIAHAVFSAFFKRDLDKQDFNYILSLCDTDISYVDFCNYSEFLRQLGDNITIMTG